MSPRKHAIRLGFLLLILLTGNAVAQQMPPVIWTVQAHDHSVVSVSFSNDGQTIVSAGGDEARTWQSADGSPLQTFPDHADGVISADISPDGQYLAVGYIVSGYPPGGVMDLWDMASETVLDTHGGCYVAFSPGNEFIASGGGGANRYAYIHRIADGVEIGSYYNGPGNITDLAYSPDGQLLAIANTNNTVRLWDTSTHTTVRTFSGHTDDVSCAAFSPDGRYLAAGAGGWDLPSDSTIKMWRLSDGELIQTFTGHGLWVYTLAFHPDGQTLVSSGRDSQTPYSASMRFWRVADGELLQDYNGLAHDFAFAPDGRTYCYGKTNGSLVLAGDASTGIADENLPTAVAVPAVLRQNYPNPFNPATTLRFELAAPGEVSLRIFSATGRRIASLVERYLPGGGHEIVWRGSDDTGRAVASGIYYYRLDVGDFREIRRMSLIR